MDIQIVDAETQLRALIERAAMGEAINITEAGQPIAHLITAKRSPARDYKPIDFAAIRALRETLPEQPENAGDFIRRLRDEDRY